MAPVTVLKALAVAASFLRVAAHKPPSVTTITIPHLGDHTKTTVIYNCGTTTVVVETPLVTKTCSVSIPTTSTQSSATSSSTDDTTSCSTTTETLFTLRIAESKEWGGQDQMAIKAEFKFDGGDEQGSKKVAVSQLGIMLDPDMEETTREMIWFTKK
ncbi:hypothetical protein NLG97_g7840 [Lecanicillium saksenae]|uniref:Uncharacterized protein n=1 Tax=Lecanicillium saksenae TaxID=468837 RepID=A0ACC1QKM8_9HYPO|nr:hypothetical protein NLG97_g7840 [Lecanicillium saksenae]